MSRKNRKDKRHWGGRVASLVFGTSNSTLRVETNQDQAYITNRQPAQGDFVEILGNHWSGDHAGSIAYVLSDQGPIATVVVLEYHVRDFKKVAWENKIKVLKTHLQGCNFYTTIPKERLAILNLPQDDNSVLNCESPSTPSKETTNNWFQQLNLF